MGNVDKCFIGGTAVAKMKAHPYADLFPMMTADELDALAADIAENGLRQPIVRYQGSILDGRNRFLGCERAKVEPTFTDHEGDDASALALVISLNVQRRDLTAAQRAIVAARSLEKMPERRGRPEKSATDNGTFRGRSTEAMAKTFKVGVNAIQSAKAILAEAPDLASQVEACALSLAAAYEQLQSRREQAKQQTKQAERAAQYGAEYREAISNGETDPGKIFAEMERRHRAEREQAEHDASARQLFHKGLEQTLRWIADWVGKKPDDHLDWYTTPGEPGTQTTVTAAEITAAITQLERVRSITFAKRKTNVPT